MYKNEVRKRAVSEIIEKKVIKVKKNRKPLFIVVSNFVHL